MCSLVVHYLLADGRDYCPFMWKVDCRIEHIEADCPQFMCVSQIRCLEKAEIEAARLALALQMALHTVK